MSRWTSSAKTKVSILCSVNRCGALSVPTRTFGTGIEVYISEREYEEPEEVNLREESAPALRPAAGYMCIVMVCTDMAEADEVGRQLSEVNSGCLVTYRRAEDLLYNAPTGKVVLIILATADTPAVISGTLKWLRRRWSRCPVAVVGDVGSGQHEIAARQGGAFYLTRPVDPQQWNALLAHVLRGSQSTGVKPRKRL